MATDSPTPHPRRVHGNLVALIARIQLVRRRSGNGTLADQHQLDEELAKLEVLARRIERDYFFLHEQPRQAEWWSEPPRR